MTFKNYFNMATRLLPKVLHWLNVSVCAQLKSEQKTKTKRKARTAHEKKFVERSKVYSNIYPKMIDVDANEWVGIEGYEEEEVEEEECLLI